MTISGTSADATKTDAKAAATVNTAEEGLKTQKRIMEWWGWEWDREWNREWVREWVREGVVAGRSE